VILLPMIKGIIAELTRLQTLPAPYRDENDAPSLPRMIATGNYGSIIVSREIDENIVAVAKKLMDDDPALKIKSTHKEWIASVRRAFGPVLAALDLNADPDTNAKTVLNEIRTALGNQVSGYGIREFAFGCTLFDSADIKAFVIGPVRFEPRQVWLDRKHQDVSISKVTCRRVKQAWSRKYLRKRKSSQDSLCEKDILDSVGGCLFVCSVSTNGLAAETGREKALTAARMATAAIALLWPTPSLALDGMNLLFDRKLHLQNILTFIPGKIRLFESRLSHRPHGPLIKTDDWGETFANYSKHFAVVGDFLHFMVDSTGNVSRPNMMNTLAQALLWFHEGCRETTSLMAIVKFSATLDALACGKKSAGIRQLIKARLGLQDTDPIHTGGPTTLKQAVDAIYCDGRSRTIHGTNDKLGHDWAGTRGIAEQFARLCLLTCIEWASSNSTSDDPKQMAKVNER